MSCLKGGHDAHHNGAIDKNVLCRAKKVKTGDLTKLKSFLDPFTIQSRKLFRPFWQIQSRV
jgi:hypothetical protein